MDKVEVWFSKDGSVYLDDVVEGRVDLSNYVMVYTLPLSELMSKGTGEVIEELVRLFASGWWVGAKKRHISCGDVIMVGPNTVMIIDAVTQEALKGLGRDVSCLPDHNTIYTVKIDEVYI